MLKQALLVATILTGLFAIAKVGYNYTAQTAQVAPAPTQTYTLAHTPDPDFVLRMTDKAKKRSKDKTYVEGFCDAVRATGFTNDDSGNLSFTPPKGNPIKFDCKDAIKFHVVTK